jgi:predicted RNase H-like HicB family nuclease
MTNRQGIKEQIIFDGEIMNKIYTALTKQVNGWWIGWIEEVPGVNCQEKTHEQLLETLKVTLKEALELNRQDALTALGTDFREEQIAI